MRTLLIALLSVFLPARGERRATSIHVPTVPKRPEPTCAEVPVIDGEELAIVRPYVVRAEQARRRRALELALDGIGIGPEIVHGKRVPA